METDSYFWQLFKKLPDTLFALLGEPLERLSAYRFVAEEIKKSYRLDGVFVPKTTDLPVYFVEVQYQRRDHFYSNLFAKAFSYLDANDPNQEWMAVAIFPSRSVEPPPQRAYQSMLTLPEVRRIYLDELSVPDDAPPGLTLLHLLTAPRDEISEPVVAKILQRSEREPDCERGKHIVELVNGLLVRRFSEYKHKEIQRMFRLEDIRKTEVWKESHQEGVDEGRVLERQQNVKSLHSKGKSLKEIAELLEMPLAEVRRLARSQNRAD